MKKYILLLTALLALSACKGTGSSTPAPKGLSDEEVNRLLTGSAPAQADTAHFEGGYSETEPLGD